MDLDKVYAVDENAAAEGKWLVTREGFDVKVAKLGNPNYVAEVMRLQKPFLSLLRSSADSSALLDEITIKAMAKTILLDWKAESEGQGVPYTVELGIQYLTKYKDFKEDISVLSAGRANFKPEEVGEK